MDWLFWAEAFHWTPSQVRAERAGEMRMLQFVHAAASEGREKRQKRESERAERRR